MVWSLRKATYKLDLLIPGKCVPVFRLRSEIHTPGFQEFVWVLAVLAFVFFLLTRAANAVNIGSF